LRRGSGLYPPLPLPTALSQHHSGSSSGQTKHHPCPSQPAYTYTCSLIHVFAVLLVYALIQLFIHPFIHLFILLFAHSRHHHNHKVFDQVWHKHHMYHRETLMYCCQQRCMLLTAAQIQEFAPQFCILLAETVQRQIGYYCCDDPFYCYHSYHR